MFFTFEFLCPSNFVSFVFILLIVFFWIFLKWFIRFLYSFSVLSQQLIYM